MAPNLILTAGQGILDNIRLANTTRSVMAQDWRGLFAFYHNGAACSSITLLAQFDAIDAAITPLQVNLSS